MRILRYSCTCAAGFVTFAGNFGGQGSALDFIFSGQSLFASEYYAKSAPAFESWPASYMSMGDPKIFNDSEVFLQAPFGSEPLSLKIK